MMKVNTIRRSRFFIFFSSVLEYGLHFATVASRRDPQFIVGGALEVTTKVRRRRPKVQLFRSMRGRSPHNSQPLQTLGYCFVVFRRYRDGLLIWYIQFGGDHTLFVTAKHFDVIRVNVVASLATQQTMLLHQFFE